MFKLLTATNPKMMKSIQYGFITAILHLAPHKLSGRNLCPNASPECIKLCLNTSGHGVMNSVQAARVKRSQLLFENPTEFYKLLYADIEKLKRIAHKEGLLYAVRLNGTSDIPSLALKVARDFPDVIFYDYTKNLATLKRTDLPSNYRLTFSRSETNHDECIEALQLGFNVAVVFEKGLPETYLGYKVIDGDRHDLRFLDKKVCIVGLAAKGKAKNAESEFVVKQSLVPKVSSVLGNLLMR
jgi:hypothetical protein